MLSLSKHLFVILSECNKPKNLPLSFRESVSEPRNLFVFSSIVEKSRCFDSRWSLNMTDPFDFAQGDKWWLLAQGDTACHFERASANREISLSFRESVSEPRNLDVSTSPLASLNMTDPFDFAQGDITRHSERVQRAEESPTVISSIVEKSLCHSEHSR